MLKRAYSLLELKDLNEDKREITGLATSPVPDRLGDIVEPKGAEFKLPIPLLWQHDHRQPIGEVYAAKVADSGIQISARMPKVEEPGTLKDRLDEAWQSIKIGLVKGLSIGFQSLEHSFMDDGGIHFMRWSWHELSAVTIPAHQLANIATVKSLDREILERRKPHRIVRLSDPVSVEVKSIPLAERKPGVIYLR